MFYVLSMSLFTAKKQSEIEPKRTSFKCANFIVFFFASGCICKKVTNIKFKINYPKINKDCFI